MKDNTVVHVCCNFVVYSMSVSNFIEGDGREGRTPNSIMEPKKDQYK